MTVQTETIHKRNHRAGLVDEFQKEYWPRIVTLVKHICGRTFSSGTAGEMIEYQLNNPGKGVRPMLIIEIYKELTAADPERILPFAAAVELIHTASLVHDDIQDRSGFRRGKRSIWRKYSEPDAINFGDILFSSGFEVLDYTQAPPDIKNRLFRMSAQAITKTARGQIAEQDMEDPERISLEEYISMARDKTGSLFQLAIAGSCSAAGMDTGSTMKDLFELGGILGTVFQMRDDIIDIETSKKHRPAGRDIIEGRVTLLPLLAVRILNRDVKNRFLSYFRSSASERTINIDALIDIYRSNGVIHEAEEMMADSIDALSHIAVRDQEPGLARVIDNFLYSLIGETNGTYC